MERYYPDIESLGVDFLLPMRVVVEQMVADPLWLERPDCPYADETKDTLRNLEIMWRMRAAKPAKKERVEEDPDKTADQRWEELATEAHSLYRDLSEIRDNLDEAETKDKLAFFRTATMLLDKLVALGERASNLKNISAYQARVLQVFDAVLSPEQRTQAQRILEDA